MALLYPFGSASSCRLDAAMAAAGVPQLTRMLVAWSSGDAAALDDLVPHVEGELRRLAGSYLRRERDGHLLQTTALINEAYLRLIDQRAVRWQNRAHFFGIAAQMMRRILVSMARARQADKRGGNAPMVPFDESVVPADERATSLVALDDALTALAALDPRRARVVELRYFGGLGVEESAEVLQVSPETVMRDWKRARAWLRAALDDTTPAEDAPSS
jgi:RNA polymerase sigma-70 factor, ECF subfamily